MKYNFLFIITLLLLVASCKIADVTNVKNNSVEKTVNNPGTTLVDVRLPEQFAKSPVKNAVNIPLSEIEKNLDFFRKQKHSVLFCNSGNQSGQAFEILRKNGIKNMTDAKTWKNILAMQNNIYNHLVFSKEKPSTYAIKKTAKIQQIAVALAEGTLLKKHVTPVPTNLVVVKGEILFKINNDEFHFKAGDVYEIPVNVEHEVTGKGKENVFILTKEL